MVYLTWKHRVKINENYFVQYQCFDDLDKADKREAELKAKGAEQVHFWAIPPTFENHLFSETYPEAIAIEHYE